MPIVDMTFKRGNTYYVCYRYQQEYWWWSTAYRDTILLTSHRFTDRNEYVRYLKHMKSGYPSYCTFYTDITQL